MCVIIIYDDDMTETILHIIGILCGESTDRLWIPHTKTNDTE